MHSYYLQFERSSLNVGKCLRKYCAVDNILYIFVCWERFAPAVGDSECCRILYLFMFHFLNFNFKGQFSSVLR